MKKAKIHTARFVNLQDVVREIGLTDTEKEDLRVGLDSSFTWGDTRAALVLKVSMLAVIETSVGSEAAHLADRVIPDSAMINLGEY